VLGLLSLAPSSPVRSRREASRRFNLDAWRDAPGRKSLYKRNAPGALLTDRLVIHNDTADELSGAREGKSISR
jgi:hypothetical protein